jgi:hypothetical protein
MIISSKASIEDLIIEALAKSPYSTGIELIAYIQKVRSVTKPAIYIALKFLIKSEIVSKVDTTYFLSRVWINKVNNLLQNKKDIVEDVIFTLGEGKSIRYQFPSLLICDTYWAHVFNLLVEWIPKDCPIVAWYPHQIFGVTRDEHEADIISLIKKSGKLALFAIDGSTSLDQKFKREWQQDHLSITTGSKARYSQNQFINVFGDILIEIFMDNKLSQAIELFYQENKELTTENVKAFEDIIAAPHKIRMKISRSKKKSSAIRKKIARDFYIPKPFKV